MFIVLSDVNPKTGKTGMDEWTEYTNDLRQRIPSDTLYEQYLNGLIGIEWDADGNYVGILPVDDDDGWGDW